MATDCTCKLEPGIYRVRSDGSIQHVTQVIVTDVSYPWYVIGSGSIGLLAALVFLAFLTHRKHTG